MFNQNQSILTIKGVGEKVAAPFFKKNIHTVNDLITFLPITYIQYQPNVFIDQQNVAVNAVITTDVKEFRTRSKLTVSNIQIAVGNDHFRVVAWNMPYLKFTFKKGDFVHVLGKYNQKDKTITLKKISVYEPDMDNVEELVSVYSKVATKSNYAINKLINTAIAEIDLPVDIKEMLTEIHSPTSYQKLELMQTKFKVIEFTNYYQKIKSMQTTVSANRRFQLNITDEYLSELIAELPFELTRSQIDVLNKGRNALAKDTPMQTLLLGDVGSGKTVVALLYCLIGIASDYQTAFLLPTEILANQVYAVVNSLFPNIKSQVLTSGVKANMKKRVKDLVEVGSCQILVGTHAILEDDVVFKNLGMVIVDEQHRFGVNQRQKLVDKGEFVNYCYLSATPIPRTLAHTLYGVIDVLELEQKPKNRIPIITKVFNVKTKSEMLMGIEKQLLLGNQVFIITPLAYEIEDMYIANSNTIYENFNKKYHGKYKVGMINGQLSSEHKNKVIEMFSNHEYDILVGTTVLEVGIDIPNATMIVVLNAERFGLATLHQLRGRVGRNDKQSFCYLLDEGNNANSTNRLTTLETVDSGAKLAEIDYQMRGMGELTGIRQSGSENFILFDLQTDQHLAGEIIETLSNK